MVTPEPVLPPSESMAFGPNRVALGQRRLTRAEYLATVTDLIGTNDAASQLVEEPSASHFSNNAHGLTVSAPAFQGLTVAATSLGTLASERLTMPMGCSRDALSEACVETVLGSWLLRAFRRPPTDAEVSRFKTLFTALRATTTSKEALAGVIEATLLSSSFLYRVEGTASAARLDGYQVASRLSYLLWGSTPDDALLQAAATSRLNTTDGRVTEFERLWASPRSKPALTRFVKEWLKVQKTTVARKDPSVLAGAPATLQADLEAEFRALVEEELLSPQGSLANFLGGTTTYVTPELARLYGLPAPNSGTTRVSLESTPRRGVLTSGLVLAAHSKESGYSVPQLGLFYRADVLCQPVPAPPVEAQGAQPPLPAPGQSYRQTFENFTNGNPSCNGCHSFINPPGFAYLPFDPIGRHSNLDAAGRAHDTQTEFPDLDGQTLRVSGAAELAEKVAKSQRVKACATRMALEHAFGRTLHEVDKPLLDAVTAETVAGRDSLFTVLRALVAHDAFAQQGPLL